MGKKEYNILYRVGNEFPGIFFFRYAVAEWKKQSFFHEGGCMGKENNKFPLAKTLVDNKIVFAFYKMACTQLLE